MPAARVDVLKSREVVQPGSRRDPGRRWSRLQVLGVLAGSALLANVFAIVFVSQEQTIYVWDRSIYWSSFQQLTKLIAEDPLQTLIAVVISVNRDDYNLLPAVILTPFGLVFGTGRLSYVLAIVNIYLLPAAFLMGVVADRIHGRWLGRRSPVILLLTVLIALAFHPMWIPTLHGRVGVAGVVVIAAFLLLYVTAPFEKQTTRNVILMGLLLCLLVLVRRWYAFWVVGFFAALAVSQLAILAARHRTAWHQYLGTIQNGLILTASFSIALFGFGTAFMVRVLLTDYADIYAAYRTTGSWLENALSLVAYFGPLTTIGWLAGLTWLSMHRQTREFGVLLTLQTVIILQLFWRTQDFGTHHYYLVVPGMILGIGVPLAHLCLQAGRGWYRRVVVGATLAVLVIGSARVVAPTMTAATEGVALLLPSERHHPEVRTDLETLDRLLGDLKTRRARAQGSIYVLASSRILNSNLLVNGCRQFNRDATLCDAILRTHDVDKRDGFPIQFLDARYVVLGMPIQYHLAPEHQRVVGILADKIGSGHGVGTAFRRLPERYELDDGVQVWLLERIEPFEEAHLSQLEREFVGHYPEMAHLFTVGEDLPGHDRYCWVKSRAAWLYSLIQRFRQDPAVSCPGTSPNPRVG